MGSLTFNVHIWVHKEKKFKFKKNLDISDLVINDTVTCGMLIKQAIR